MVFEMPLMFADADAVVTIIAIVIGIIGWIVKLISNAGNPVPPVPAKGRPPVRQRDDKLSQEISVFLEESAKKPAGRGNDARPQKPIQRSTSGTKGAKKPAPPPEPKPKKPPRRLVPGSDVASRHLESNAGLGENVRKSVKQHLADNVAKEVSQHLKSRIGESVAEHLGTSVGASSVSPPATSKAQGFAESLRNPATLRQAIVLNMILSRPRSLERK